MQQLFEQAVGCHQSGRLLEAERLCRQILQRQPGHGDALHMLGILALQRGEPDVALELLRAASARMPTNAYTYFNLGDALGAKGLFDEAIAALRQALALDPGMLAAYSKLGLALRMVGRLDDAMRVYQRAIAVHPQAVECYCGLGNVLIKKGMLKEAADIYRQAIARDANYMMAHRGLAKALELQGDIPAAAAAFEAARAVAADPANHDFELGALGVGDTPPAPPPKFVSSLFDAYAENFDEHLRQLHYMAPQLLFDAIRAVNPQQPMDIIDLGCGTGICGELFRPMARRLGGVDLSPKIIAKARQRGIYDELKVQDITVALQESPGQFDLIVAADVFVYVGDLGLVFQAATTALRPDGLLAFSIESAETGDYVLRSSRRYAHSVNYIQRLASGCGFKEVSTQEAVLRTKNNLPLKRKIIVLRHVDG